MTFDTDDLIAVDFDGVLHSSVTPWRGVEEIPDPPVPGAIEWLHQMVQRFWVVIHSVRANDPEAEPAIVEWLLKNGLPKEDLGRIQVSAEKPNAWVFIDDRGWRFEGPGTFPTVAQVEAFKPWNKRVGSPEGKRSLAAIGKEALSITPLSEQDVLRMPGIPVLEKGSR